MTLLNIMKRQGQIAAAMISNFSAAQKSMDSMEHSAGNAMQEMNVIYDSIEYRLNKLSQTGVGISQNLFNRDDMKAVISLITKLAEALDFVTDKLGLFGTVLTGIGVSSFIKNLSSIKTWVSELGKVQAVINSISTQSALVNAGTGLLTTESLNALSVSVSGLSEKQALLALSTKNLTTEQTNQVLVNAGIIASNEKISASLVQRALTGTALDAEQKSAILTTLGLVDANTGLIISTASCTKEELTRALATQGITGTNAEAITSTLGLAAANNTTTASFGLLGNAIKSMLLTNPIGWLILLGTAVFGVVKAVDYFTESEKEAQEALSDAKSEFQAVTSELQQINDELKTSKDRITELQSIGSLTYVEESELEKLKEATKELERQRDIKNIEAKRAAEDLYESNKNAFNKDENFNDSDFSIKNVDLLASTDTPAMTMAESGLTGLVTAIKKVREEREKAQTEGDVEAVENLTSAEREYKKQLEDLLPNLQKYKDNLNDISKYENLTEEQNKFNDTLDQGIKLVYRFTDPSAWNQIEFDQIFNDKAIKEVKDDLLNLASAGKLDENTIKQYAELNDTIKNTDFILTDGETAVQAFIEQITALAREVPKAKEELSDLLPKQQTIEQINSMSAGLESLDKIMASMKGKDPFDFTLLNDKNFTETFSKLGTTYTDFIEQVSSSPKDIAGTQTSFDNLTTSLIDSIIPLEKYTEENKNLVTAMLKNMGVVNAEEVVTNRLAIAQENLTAKKYYNEIASDNLKNATAEELATFVDEANGADVSKQALAELALNKIAINDIKIDTASDIDQVIALANAAGASTSALEQLAKAKSLFSTINTALVKGTAQLANPSSMSGIMAGVSTASELLKNNTIGDFNEIQKALGEIESGTYDFGIELNSDRYKKVTYGGANKTNKSSGSGSKKDKKDFSEIFDWVATTIDRVDEKIEKLKDKISDANGWKAKNTITGTAIDEMSTKVTALQSQIVEYQGKLKEADEKLNATYIDKIKNGTIEVEKVTDEVISKNIKEYQDWYNKINNVNKELDSTKKAMQELAKSRLDNIINDFNSLTSLMGKYSSYRKNLIDLQKSLGQEISNTDYERLINQQESIYNQLQSEYSSLQSELSKAISVGTIKIGSEEWRKYNGELIGINSSMNESVSSMNDFRKALMDLPFERLQTVASEFERFNSGVGAMIEVMGSEGTTLDGMVTAKGLAQIALYGKQYANAKQQAAEYSNAISALNEMYDSGSITQEEYNSKLSEYNNAQLSAVKATKQAEDAIVQFRKTAIQEQVDDYNKLIEAKKKARDEDKSYKEYLDQIAEKQKAISTLQSKIDELSTNSDTSDRSAIAMRLQLENDLVSARKDLTKTQNDYAYDQTTKSLDKQSEEYKNAKNKELDELETSYDAQQKVVKDYLGQVKDNYKTVYNTLTQYGKDYGVTMTDELTSPWDSASSAVDTFQSAVSDAIAQVSIDIGNLDLSKLTDMVQTMNGFSGGGSGSSFEDITGTGTWHKNKTGDWYGASNDDYASGGTYTIGGKQYNFNEDGYMKTGWNDDSGEWRYFEPKNGQMVKSTWRKDKKGKEYYLKSDGTMATDMAVKAKSGNGYYYLDNDGAWDGKTLSYEDVRKKNITVGYKNGTLSTKDELAIMDEEGSGSELMNKQGTLMQFKNGDAVFDKSKTKALWEMADAYNNPTGYLTDKLLRNQMSLSSAPMVSRVNQPVSIAINKELIRVDGNADQKTLIACSNMIVDALKNDLPKYISYDRKNR